MMAGSFMARRKSTAIFPRGGLGEFDRALPPTGRLRMAECKKRLHFCIEHLQSIRRLFLQLRPRMTIPGAATEWAARPAASPRDETRRLPEFRLRLPPTCRRRTRILANQRAASRSSLLSRRGEQPADSNSISCVFKALQPGKFLPSASDSASSAPAIASQPGQAPRKSPKLSVGRRVARGVAARGFGRHGRLSADGLSGGLGHGRTPEKVDSGP